MWVASVHGIGLQVLHHIIKCLERKKKNIRLRGTTFKTLFLLICIYVYDQSIELASVE